MQKFTISRIFSSKLYQSVHKQASSSQTYNSSTCTANYNQILHNKKTSLHG